MEKVYIDKEIYQIQNILKLDQLKTLQEYAADESDWHNYSRNEYTYSYQKSANITELCLILDTLYDYIENYVEPGLKIARSKNIIKIIPNQFDHNTTKWAMNPHADNSGNLETSDIKKGLVFYINDNFDGGEINYINKDIVLKPVENSIIVHPAYNDYKHGVHPVTSGNRYCITDFFR